MELWANHLNVATLTSNLGSLYLYQKKYDQVLPHLRSPHPGGTSRAGNIPMTANVRHNLVQVHFRSAFKEAVPPYC